MSRVGSRSIHTGSYGRQSYLRRSGSPWQNVQLIVMISEALSRNAIKPYLRYTSCTRHPQRNAAQYTPKLGDPTAWTVSVQDMNQGLVPTYLQFRQANLSLRGSGQSRARWPFSSQFTHLTPTRSTSRASSEQPRIVWPISIPGSASVG